MEVLGPQFILYYTVCSEVVHKYYTLQGLTFTHSSVVDTVKEKKKANVSS